MALLQPDYIRRGSQQQARETTFGKLCSMVNFKSTSIVFLVLMLPAFLIASNVRLIINSSALYNYGFDKYNIPYRTGIEKDELLSAGKQIREYFNSKDEFLDVRVEFGGVTRSIYNLREITHMKDVKNLVQISYRIQEVSAIYILIFVLLGFWSNGRRFIRIISRYFAIGGAVTAGLVLSVGLLSVIGFERLFLAFHIVSFSNDLWQLDPSKDFLIAMFPEEFFFTATMMVAAATILESILLIILPTIVGRFHRSTN